MEKINCNIIRDILPIYADETVSDETKKMIDEHLITCDFCSEELALLKKQIELPDSEKARMAEADSFKKVKRKLKLNTRIKVIVAAILAVVVTVGCLYAYYIYMQAQIYTISADAVTAEMNKTGDIISLVHDGKSCTGMYWTSAEITDGNEKKRVIFMTIRRSKWAEMFWNQSDVKTMYTVVSHDKSADNVLAVYFVNSMSSPSVATMSQEELTEYMKSCTLIYEAE